MQCSVLSSRRLHYTHLSSKVSGNHVFFHAYLAHGDRFNRATHHARSRSQFQSPRARYREKGPNERTPVRMYMIAKDSSGLTSRMLKGSKISAGSYKAEQKGICSPRTVNVSQFTPADWLAMKRTRRDWEDAPNAHYLTISSCWTVSCCKKR